MFVHANKLQLVSVTRQFRLDAGRPRNNRPPTWRVCQRIKDKEDFNPIESKAHHRVPNHDKFSWTNGVDRLLILYAAARALKSRSRCCRSSVGFRPRCHRPRRLAICTPVGPGRGSPVGPSETHQFHVAAVQSYLYGPDSTFLRASTSRDKAG